MEKNPLKMNIPENLGIPSKAILNFVNHLEEQGICAHSFMFVRHGEIAAEGYYPPFTPDKLHRMYSTSKSFVSMAIGLMIDEGKISLDDKVASFFPEYCPEDMHPYIAETTVRNLLMMSSPYRYNSYREHDDNWVWTFFNRQPTLRPGFMFNYDTSATVTLNGIVEKLSGQELMEYLRPRLFDPIGISEDAWSIQRPEGGAWGGSGILCSTHDFAKFALVLLNGGRYNGQQLISEAYVKEATSALIDNRVSTDKPELQYGYGYQIWKTRNDGFATVGMGSQISVGVPEKDFVFVITADTQIIPAAHNTILALMWNDVYSQIADETLPPDIESYNKLTEKLNSLEFLPVSGNLTTSADHNKKYKLLENPMKISDIEFKFGEKTGRMIYTNATGEHEIKFGFGGYVYDELSEAGYYGKQIGVAKDGFYEYKASAAWFDDDSLIIYLYVIDDYLGTLKINVRFKGDDIAVQMSESAEWFLLGYNGFATGTLEE